MAGIKDLITQIPPEYRLYLQTMFPGQKTGAIDEGYFSQDFKDQLKDQVLSKIEMGLGFDSPPAYDESMRFMFPSGTVTKGTILPADYRTAANPAGTTDPKYYKGERGSSPTGYSSAFNTLGTYQYEYKMPTAPAFDNAAIVVTDKYDWNPMYGTVPEQNFTGYIGEGFGDVKGSDVDEKMLFEFVKNQIKDKKLDTASALELIGNYLGPKESKGEGRDIRIEIPVDTPTATTDDAKREIREVDTRRGAVRGAQQDISNYQDFGEVPLAKGGRVGYALGSPEPLNVSNEEKRIAFDLYQALKDIEEQYTGETIAGDPSPQNLDPSDRRQGTLMAGGDFPEFENYADVIDAYNSGVAVEPGESLTDYIKRNNIKIKEIEMDPLGDLKKVELVDELEPGPLKDELKEKFDPSQETYEEYLRRINLDRPFNAQDGGRVLAREGFGGGIEAQKKGTAASVAAFKAREVDRIRPTFYDGKLDIKGPEKLIEQYKIDFAKRLKFPKGGSEYKKAVALGEILSDADLAKKYNITIGDVERINRVVKRDLGTYAVPDKKRYKTGVIRREELEKVTDLGLEQEYTKLKKGERIGNPDLAHRVSKKYNVTTSNLGLDNPLINRVIVKPNERDISRLYDKRIKIENKYKLKDGTFKKPSKKDIKILEQINNDVETLARETKGRLSAVVNDPTNLNKPYGSLGVDASKTIGGGVIDVDLKDVRKLPLEDQAFLKANLLELKNKELGKTPEMLADEFKDVLNKPDVQKRIENIISKGNMEKPYVDQAKKLLNIGKTVARPLLRVAAPFIPVLGAVGVGLGAADVAKAAEFTKKPDELGLAYLLGPEKAKDYSEFKESVRGKADETEEFVP